MCWVDRNRFPRYTTQRWLTGTPTTTTTHPHLFHNPNLAIDITTARLSPDRRHSQDQRRRTRWPTSRTETCTLCCRCCCWSTATFRFAALKSGRVIITVIASVGGAATTHKVPVLTLLLSSLAETHSGTLREYRGQQMAAAASCSAATTWSW